MLQQAPFSLSVFSSLSVSVLNPTVFLHLQLLVHFVSVRRGYHFSDERARSSKTNRAGRKTVDFFFLLNSYATRNKIQGNNNNIFI